jgi:two-component system, cell cycle sensor histidine kinase and response regulator CckA
MRILHIEDSAADAELVREMLTEEWPECSIDVIESPDDLLASLEGAKYDLILSDFSLGSFTGLDALKIAKGKSPETPFIFLSGTIGEDRAIEALQAGAQDYVIKDRMKRLVTAIHRALKDTQDRSSRDVAERRIREQADLLNKARDAIIVTNLEGFITFWNTGAERVSGWTSDEVLGHRLEEILKAELHSELHRVREGLEVTDEWRGEIRVNDKSGKGLVVDLRTTLVRDDQGRPKARLSIGTDITEKKRLEEQFLRVQRLESIGMLASGIAHDLNNVLAPIFLAAPMLREHATDPMDLRMISSLEKSAERGAGLVRQILAFAHGVQGVHQVLQVKHLIRDTVSVIKETFPKNIRLHDSVPGDLCPIMGNPTQIHQVLLNLCVNARDAMPEGGTLTLQAENCVLDEAGMLAIEGGQPGGWVVLHVEDSGTGIPPEVLLHIWEPFFTTKEAGKGTGLGLPTVRGIVESHRGFINLKTEVGRGTVFRVYLPAAEGPGQDSDSKSSHPFTIRGKGELILIVDDEQQIRDAAAATLSRYGYRVLVAKDGAEALALFSTRSNDIQLVITDINMPDLDGATFANVVRHLNSKVHILAMSGLASGSLNPQMQKIANAFISKPFKAKELLRAVDQLLSPKP